MVTKDAVYNFLLVIDLWSITKCKAVVQVHLKTEIVKCSTLVFSSDKADAMGFTVHKKLSLLRSLLHVSLFE